MGMYVLGQAVALHKGGMAEQNLRTCFVYLSSFFLFLIAEISIFSGKHEVLKNRNPAEHFVHCCKVVKQCSEMLA